MKKLKQSAPSKSMGSKQDSTKINLEDQLEHPWRFRGYSEIFFRYRGSRVEE